MPPGSRPSVRASPRKRTNSFGSSVVMICADASEVMISASSGSVALPHQWSPSECVLTTLRSGAAPRTSAISLSIRRVSVSSHSVSTSSASPPPTTSPALDSPHSPRGWIHACAPGPTSSRCGVASVRCIEVGQDASSMSLPAPETNTTVVVTGASSGIGAELARELSRRGHHVTLVARRRERLDELAAELGEATAQPADLADPAGRATLLGVLRNSGHAVIGLCNNAGFGTFGRFWELDGDTEAQQVQLNVVALHELCSAFLPSMVSRGAGAILNVGSIAGVQPLPGNATYAATKAFVNSFSEAVHTELKGTGVSCTVLTPGPVRTEFMEVSDGTDLESRAPSFTWQTPHDVARQAVDGMVRGRRVVTPGLAIKVASTSGRLT